MRKVRKVRKANRYGAVGLRRSCGELRKKYGRSKHPQKIRNLPQIFRNLKPSYCAAFRRNRRIRSIPGTQHTSPANHRPAFSDPIKSRLDLTEHRQRPVIQFER